MLQHLIQPPITPFGILAITHTLLSPLLDSLRVLCHASAHNVIKWNINLELILEDGYSQLNPTRPPFSTLSTYVLLQRRLIVPCCGILIIQHFVGKKEIDVLVTKTYSNKPTID